MIEDMGGSMGVAKSLPAGKSMSRREFVGLMLASVAAILAGASVWRAFRRAVMRSDDPRAATLAVITAIDKVKGTITIEYGTAAHRSVLGVSGGWYGGPMALGDDIMIIAR